MKIRSIYIMANYYIETGKVSGKMGTAYIKMGSETYELANIKELAQQLNILYQRNKDWER